jgi:hypothetical protein
MDRQLNDPRVFLKAHIDLADPSGQTIKGWCPLCGGPHTHKWPVAWSYDHGDVLGGPFKCDYAPPDWDPRLPRQYWLMFNDVLTELDEP